jgi:hypothetical protein
MAISTKVTVSEFIEQREKLTRRAEILNSTIANRNGHIGSLETRIEIRKTSGYRKELEKINRAINFEQVIKSTPQLYSCSSATPTLDLERPDGPLYNIVQNNQGSIGTCYANTAKNLLSAATGGKINASYLDIALLYKKVHPSSFALDGGRACPAIKEVSQHRYCDDVFSPIELMQKGEVERAKVEAEFGIFPTNYRLGLGHQHTILNALDKFIKITNRFKNSPRTDYQRLSQKIPAILASVFESDGKLGLPKLKNYILQKSDLDQMYIWNYQKKVPSGNTVLSHTQFWEDYRESWRKTKPEVFRMLMEKVNFNTFKQAFYRQMSPFFTKYNLTARVNDTYYTRAFKSMYDQNIIRDWSISMDNAAKVFSIALDRELTPKEAFNETYYGVNPTISLIVDFLESVDRLVQIMVSDQIPLDRLLDENGHLHDGFNLIQLATAPRCLNSNNRKPLNLDYSCVRRTPERLIHPILQGKRKTRVHTYQWLIHQLKQDLAIGNIFRSPPSWHVNSIVGHRYNHSKGHCEFKIRESAGAQVGSYWMNTDTLIDRLSQISILRVER